SREIVDEIEWILDLVRDTSGELTQRGEFLRLHQAILRCAQVFQRGGQFARAGLDALEQAPVLNGDRCLVREWRGYFTLVIGERTHFRAGQSHNTFRNALA